MPVVRLTKNEEFQLNLSEKLILFYRDHPVEAANDLLGIQLTWFQRKVLRDLWNKKYNLLLMSRGIGKTWLIALFVVLYGMLHCGVQIGIITPSFKQTDFLYDKIADFYEASAYLRASVHKFQRTTFRALMRFHNGSFIEGLPLGTGEKIRGRRYNIVAIDEYAFVDEDIIKKVVRPMLNVKKKGIENKLIISSTAYYSWNHFYLQYLLFNVMEQRAPEKYALHEYTIDDVLMIKDPPFELDKEIYEMMRMDTSEEIYMMENKCLTDCNTIVCKDSIKSIKDVEVGNYVLSGSGRFEKVLKTSERLYSGEIIRIKGWKNAHEDLEVTPEHPIFIKRDDEYQYIEAKDVKISDKIAFRIPKSKNKKFNEEKAYIMGLYLAEGTISIRSGHKKREKNKNKKEYSLGFHFHRDEIEYQNLVVSFFNDIGKNACFSRPKEIKSTSVYAYHTGETPGPFSDLLEFGRVSYLKRIPSYVFDWSESAKKAFIMGILDGDGYYRPELISLDLVSENVVKNLKYLLVQLGVQSNICYYKDDHPKHHDVWRLNITSKSSEVVYSWYGDKEIYSRKCTRTYGDIDGIYSWYSIKSISSVDYNGYVYNLEIENDPSYITSVCQVHNCLFPIDNVGFFSARLIDACTPRAKESEDDLCPIELEGNPDCFYAMGIDAARVAGGDNFAISILKLENGVKKVVHSFTLNGSPYQEMIYHIRRFTQIFNIVQINCDSGGGGTTIKDLLMEPYKTIDGRVLSPILDMDDREMLGREGIPMLRMVNFTRPVVNDLYMRLKADMQHKTLQFPIDIRRHSDKELEKAGKEIIETKRELLVLQAEGRGNHYTFDVPSQFKKDRATALTLSNQAANDFLTNLTEEPQTELCAGFWI